MRSVNLNHTGTTSFHIESDGVAVVNFDNIEFVGSGGGAPNYANPHAATMINGVTQTYDNNGNLTGTGGGLANTWNYQNRLTQSQGAGTASTSYLYDHTGQRTSKTSGGVTTHYPSALYEAQGATTTKNVYVGDQVVATIQSDTPGPKTFHNHLDHLGSTQVVSTPDGHLNQEMAYYPFGSPRITNQYGELNQKNRYIGQDYDEESSLSYLNARYYNSTQGRFISQDPVFWEVGRTQDGTRILFDPQLANSYSYAGNNPILTKDPSGRIIPLLLWGVASYLTAQGISDAYLAVVDYNLARQYPNTATDAERAELLSTALYEGSAVAFGFFIKPPVESIAFDVTKVVVDSVRSGVKRAFQGPAAPVYVTTPATTQQQTQGSGKQETISAPSSRGGGSTGYSKTSTALNYLASAQIALNKGDKGTAQKFIDKARKELNTKRR